MNKIIKNIKNIIYFIGILTIFSIEVVGFYQWFDKKNEDWYTLFLIIIAFYSTCIMISKIIRSNDLLEKIQNIIHNKNMKDSEKINSLDFIIFDVDSYLNNK